jgi:hypothetical protein
VAEAAVGGRQPGIGQGNFKEILRKFTAGEALGQNSRRNLSWILAAQEL